MRLITIVFALACGLFAVTRAAEAAVQINVDLSSQTMSVSSSSGESYLWPISSARSGYITPRGSYRVQHLEAMHYSKKYEMSPMPHSIFFRGGYAIHGTGAVAQLGRPASHGCIRLSRANAAILYAMVKIEGGRISISGAPPRTTMYAQAHHKRHTPPSVYASHHQQPNPLAYAPAVPSTPHVPLKIWMFNPAGQ